MIKPKDIQISDQDGEMRTFIMHRFDCESGREIATQYLTANAPKIGSYAVSQELMYKLMRFVAVPMENGNNLFLTTSALVKNHVPDWETLLKIEMEMMEYNCSFFARGKISKSLQTLEGMFQALITRTLTALSEQSSQVKKPRSTS
jgi:hypothetical protein